MDLDSTALSEDEFAASISANRIVLKRSSHVSDASSIVTTRAAKLRIAAKEQRPLGVNV
jgi:hypothetical protein